MAFERNVFINCPFDSGYRGLLRPLLFTIIYLKLNPRIALERTDSGESRVSKIIGLILESKFAIHDLSRLQATRKGEYFRLNMPFELGIDVGCRSYGGAKMQSKKFLILEEQAYRYQAALSDISGSDIAVHGNQPDQVVVKVRNWVSTLRRNPSPGASKIWGAFGDFMADNYLELKKRGFSTEQVDDLEVPELIACMKRWIRLQGI